MQGPSSAVEPLQAKQAQLEQERQQAERRKLEQERVQRQQQLQQQEAQDRRCCVTQGSGHQAL